MQYLLTQEEYNALKARRDEDVRTICPNDNKVWSR